MGGPGGRRNVREDSPVKKLVAIALVGLILVPILASPVQAWADGWHGGGWHGGGYHGGGWHGGGWHGGGWHGGGWHHHGFGSSVFIGGSFYYPWYYPAYPYYSYPYSYPYAYPYGYAYSPPDDSEWEAGPPASSGEEDQDDASAYADARSASYGLVQLRGVPDGATVDLDGREWLHADGLDQRWMALPDGEHVITVRVDNRAPQERRIVVKAGSSQTVRFGQGR